MAVSSENQTILLVREFPRRLLRAKKELEIERGEELSWAWIAQEVGKSTTVMSQIKTGEREPTVEEGVLFAGLFGVRVAWLLLGEEPMRDGRAAPPTVLQESSADSQEVSHHGTQRKGQRRSDGRGQAG
jgi:hypothetical protein